MRIEPHSQATVSRYINLSPKPIRKLQSDEINHNKAVKKTKLSIKDTQKFSSTYIKLETQLAELFKTQRQDIIKAIKRDANDLATILLHMQKQAKYKEIHDQIFHALQEIAPQLTDPSVIKALQAKITTLLSTIVDLPEEILIELLQDMHIPISELLIDTYKMVAEYLNEAAPIVRSNLLEIAAEQKQVTKNLNTEGITQLQKESQKTSVLEKQLESIIEQTLEINRKAQSLAAEFAAALLERALESSQDALDSFLDHTISTQELLIPRVNLFGPNPEEKVSPKIWKFFKVATYQALEELNAHQEFKQTEPQSINPAKTTSTSIVELLLYNLSLNDRLPEGLLRIKFQKVSTKEKTKKTYKLSILRQSQIIQVYEINHDPKTQKIQIFASGTTKESLLEYKFFDNKKRLLLRGTLLGNTIVLKRYPANKQTQENLYIGNWRVKKMQHYLDRSRGEWTEKTSHEHKSLKCKYAIQTLQKNRHWTTKFSVIKGPYQKTTIGINTVETKGSLFPLSAHGIIHSTPQKQNYPPPEIIHLPAPKPQAPKHISTIA